MQGMRTVTTRMSSATRETIAEGMHACLALIAVVLLARAQNGAFDRAPATWVVLPISILIWGAAAAATRWSPRARQPWLAAWRSCVSPTLIALIVGGRGSVQLLLCQLSVIAIGIGAVGYFAYRSGTSAAEGATLPAEVMPIQSVTRETSADSVAGAPASSQPSAKPFVPPPVVQSAPAPVVEAVAVRPQKLDESRMIQRLDPAHDNAERHLATPLIETEETPSPETSSETESWTRREFEGEVSIEAVVLARFTEGSKLAVLHLPFVPPLPELPQIECEPLDSGCDITITTESAYRHGAKLNVTRRSAGPAESVPIGIVIYTSVEEEIES